jgi:hypothetical protein
MKCQKELGIRYGVEVDMYKKKVWEIGCAIFLLLIVCTVLSTIILNGMRIEVWTTSGKTQNENGLEEILLPQSCVDLEEEPAVYYIVQEQSIFRTEWKVAKKRVTIIEEQAGEIAVLDENMRDENGRKLQVIYYSAYPVKEGDVVVPSDE